MHKIIIFTLFCFLFPLQSEGEIAQSFSETHISREYAMAEDDPFEEERDKIKFGAVWVWLFTIVGVATVFSGSVGIIVLGVISALIGLGIGIDNAIKARRLIKKYMKENPEKYQGQVSKLNFHIFLSVAAIPILTLAGLLFYQWMLSVF